MENQLNIGDRPVLRGLYLAALILFVMLMSLYVWMDQGIRLDEAQSIWQTSRDLSGVFKVIAKDVHVPLYFVGLHFWEVVFGADVVSLRLFSLLFYLLSIPAIFYMAKEAYNARVAYFTSLITAISPFLNWYGSEGRMYSMLFLITTLSHFLFIRLWKRPTGLAWLSFAILTICGLFTHLFFSFVILVQALFFLKNRGLFRASALGRFSFVAFVCAVAGGAWFIYRYLAGAGLTNPLLVRPTSFDFFNVFSNFFLGFQTDSLNTFALSFWPILVLIAFTFISKKKEYEPQTFYFVLASFIPIVLAFIVSVFLHPLFLSRYLIICLPSMYVLAVYFLSSYKGYVGDFAITLIIVFMMAMLVIQAIEPNSPVKEDYESAAHYVASRADIDDIFVVSAPFITYPVEYYYRGDARLVTFPKWERYSEILAPEPYTPELVGERMAEFAEVYEHIYLLLGYDQGYEEELRLYMDQHYERVEVKPFSPGLTLYVYRLRYI